MANKTGAVVKQAEALAAPYAAALGLTLWDVQFVKEGAEWYLRYFIDKPGGVTIDDCEALSRAIDDPLDQADLIDRSYLLEVSSPGLCRELTRPEHFAAMRGRPVTLRLYRAAEGLGKTVTGTLLAKDETGVTVQPQGGEPLCFAPADVAAVHLADDLDDDCFTCIEEEN